MRLKGKIRPCWGVGARIGAASLGLLHFGFLRRGSRRTRGVARSSSIAAARGRRRRGGTSVCHALPTSSQGSLNALRTILNDEAVAGQVSISFHLGECISEGLDGLLGTKGRKRNDPQSVEILSGLLGSALGRLLALPRGRMQRLRMRTSGLAVAASGASAEAAAAPSPSAEAPGDSSASFLSTITTSSSSMSLGEGTVSSWPPTAGVDGGVGGSWHLTSSTDLCCWKTYGEGLLCYEICCAELNSYGLCGMLSPSLGKDQRRASWF